MGARHLLDPLSALQRTGLLSLRREAVRLHDKAGANGAVPISSATHGRHR